LPKTNQPPGAAVTLGRRGQSKAGLIALDVFQDRKLFVVRFQYLAVYAAPLASQHGGDGAETSLRPHRQGNRHRRGSHGAMKLPNAENAVIDRAKIVQYLLDVDHPQGGSKARLLHSLGYSAADWTRLESDLRAAHLSEDVLATRQTLWGMRYEVLGPLTGPTGDSVLFRSVWQIDVGTDRPRLITMYPE